MVEDGCAVIRSTGEDASAGRGAIRSGVESVKAEAVFDHRVEIGRLKNRVSIVTGFAPALVIGHDENDVGAFVCGR